MIKKLGIFTIFLCAIGTGLSLYLPAPSVIDPSFDSDIPPVYEGNELSASPTPFTIIGSSLEDPVDINLLQSSSQLLGNEEVEYALQLGIYGTLNNAKAGALAFDNKKLPRPLSPVILGVKDQQRQWFIVILGPLKSQNEQLKYKQLLLENKTSSQAILWPVIESNQ